MLNLYESKMQQEKLIKYSIGDKTIFFLYSLFFIMKPFYFWDSGIPQVSDFFMTILIAVFIVKKKFNLFIPIASKIFMLTGLLFVSYVTFVNLTWMLILSGPLDFVNVTVFYIYNFIIVLLIVGLYEDYKDKIIELTYKSMLLSVLIQIFKYIIDGGFSESRITSGFNNPNQLGYYSLLVLSILLFLSTRIKIRLRGLLMGIFSSLVLVLASLSKAAILSYIGLLFLFIFSSNDNKKLKRNFIIIVIIIMGIITYIYKTTYIIQDNKLFQGVQMRISLVGKDNDDSLEGRGYDRIFRYPKYWILGAGEGEVSRFDGFQGELHSTLGNLQVSYGFIGLVLFLRFIYIALKNDKFVNWYVIFFIIIYGLTHNGIRNSMLWILFALMSIGKSEGNKDTIKGYEGS